MKKLSVLFFAIALVASFGVPAVAADGPAWNFYGSARMATWYSNTNEDVDKSIADDTIGPDEGGTIWDLQGNSRVGASTSAWVRRAGGLGLSIICCIIGRQ